MKKSSIITGICLFLLGSFSCKTSTGIYSVLPKKSYPALSGDIYVYSAYDCDCRKKAYIGEGYYTSKSQLYRVPDDLAEKVRSVGGNWIYPNNPKQSTEKKEKRTAVWGSGTQYYVVKGYNTQSYSETTYEGTFSIYRCEERIKDTVDEVKKKNAGKRKDGSVEEEKDGLRITYTLRDGKKNGMEYCDRPGVERIYEISWLNGSKEYHIVYENKMIKTNTKYYKNRFVVKEYDVYPSTTLLAKVSTYRGSWDRPGKLVKTELYKNGKLARVINY